MTLQTYPDVAQGGEEWHNLRRGLVTASSVGQLLSVTTLSASGFGCPLCEAAAGEPCLSVRTSAPLKMMHSERAAWAKENATRVIEPATGDTARSLTRLLVAERITGWTDPTYMSDDMIRGIEDEPRAVETYAQHYKAPVQRMGFMVRKESWGTLGFSPDSLVGTDGFVEVKSRRAKKQLQTILDWEVPSENMAQIQAGLLVSGRQWCDYISFTGGMPMPVMRVEPDEKWFAAIREAVQLFEETAAMWMAVYRKKTAGLAVPERIEYQQDMVI